MPQVSRFMNRWLWVLALCWFSVLILFFHSFLLLFTNNDAFAMVISCCHFFLSLVFYWTRKSRKMKKWFSWLSHYMNVFFLWPAGDCSGIKCYIKIVSFFDTYQGILCVFFPLIIKSRGNLRNSYMLRLWINVLPFSVVYPRDRRSDF